MDRCPVEIVQQISSYACTDGGKTGCALSLVSRYVRQATSSYRFYSVALLSHKSVLAFTQTVERVGPGFDSAIIHLLVHLDLYASGEGTGYHGLNDSIAAILLRAAPTIKTLFYMVPECYCSHDVVFGFLYPVLEDLLGPWHGRSDNDTTAYFPSVKRLHLVNGPTASRRVLWQHLAYHMPALEDIRVTLNTAIDRLLPEFLHIRFGIPCSVPDHTNSVHRVTGASYPLTPTPGVLSGARAAAQMTRLKTMYVQLRDKYGDNSGWCGYNGHAFLAFASRLARIAQQSESAGTGRVYYLGIRCDAYGLEELRTHWEDLLEGGDGPWSPMCSGSRGQ